LAQDLQLWTAHRNFLFQTLKTYSLLTNKPIYPSSICGLLSIHYIRVEMTLGESIDSFLIGMPNYLTYLAPYAQGFLKPKDLLSYESQPSGFRTIHLPQVSLHLPKSSPGRDKSVITANYTCINVFAVHWQNIPLECKFVFTPTEETFLASILSSYPVASSLVSFLRCSQKSKNAVQTINP
jgi:hypothetical protein